MSLALANIVWHKNNFKSIGIIIGFIEFTGPKSIFSSLIIVLITVNFQWRTQYTTIIFK